MVYFCGFFDYGSVVLCYLIDGIDCCVDFIEFDCLFVWGCGDGVYFVIDVCDVVFDLFKCSIGLIYELDIVCYFFVGVLD